MGLIIAIIVAGASVLIAIVTVLANGMSDSPTTSISPWPPLLIGLPIAAVLAFTHFHSISW